MKVRESEQEEQEMKVESGVVAGGRERGARRAIIYLRNWNLMAWWRKGASKEQDASLRILPCNGKFTLIIGAGHLLFDGLQEFIRC